MPPRRVPVDASKFGPHNSWGQTDFMERGYYVDEPFTCPCGTSEVFTAEQQQWWYEVAKGYLWSTARHCHECRDARNARAAESRRKSQDGMLRKAPTTSRGKGIGKTK